MIAVLFTVLMRRSAIYMIFLPAILFAAGIGRAQRTEDNPAQCKKDELSPARFTMKTAYALRALGPMFDPEAIARLARAKGCHSPAAWSWESLPGDSSIVLWLNASGMRVVQVRTEEKINVLMNSNGGWGCDPADCRSPEK